MNATKPRTAVTIQDESCVDIEIATTVGNPNNAIVAIGNQMWNCHDGTSLPRKSLNMRC